MNGRALSATPKAADCYRAAQTEHRDEHRLLAALQHAVALDPGFALAATDLAVLEGRPVGPMPAALHPWERHHIEVVSAAAHGDARRAIDLLREHLSDVGQDVIASLIVNRCTTGCHGESD